MTTIDAQAIAFTVGLPPVALRRNRETRNNNYRSRLKRDFQEAVWIAGRECAKEAEVWRYWPWERAHVHYCWWSTHETDNDNIIATMKPALDVIKATGPRPLGIVADDGPGVRVTATWQKARTKAAERVEITVTRDDDVEVVRV